VSSDCFDAPADQKTARLPRGILEGEPGDSGLCGCPRKTQLICLPAYLEPRLAREVGYVWAALSSACHYHPYDLAPTAAELSGWIDAVATLLASITGKTPGSRIGA